MEMAAKGMKRLEILIPDNHPLFDHPPRWRARVAREWLDLGARLSAVEQELRNLQTQIVDLKGPTRMESSDQSACNETLGVSFATGRFTKALTDAFG
jgi:hypothetical protein